MELNNLIHGIYLTDVFKCENFRETKTLHSLFVTSLLLEGEKSDYYTLQIDQLKTNPKDIFKNLCNARTGLLIQAQVIRDHNGLKDNSTNLPLDKKEIGMILKKADIEIEFERIRRSMENSAHLPSRLTCLFLCENDPEYNGKFLIQNVLSDYSKRPYVCNVQITNKLAYHKADYRWYDKYFLDSNIQYIENYWRGVEFKESDEGPRWEHLLEGSIALSSEEDYENISRDGTFLNIG
ncbi:hypothetical protein [Sphingobacterium multivorum]|uniref:hypothetical protein n=1 Tax=Sphingobacterium multivorum TaxID=28454 RepID=UPI003DA1E75E